MSVKQWDDETPDTPDVNVYLYTYTNTNGDELSYWVVEVDTNDDENEFETRVYVNDGLVEGE